MDQQEYITLVFGCGNNKVEHRIDLHTKKIDKWNQNRVKALSFKTKEVSAVIVGPKTVFEFYMEDNYQNQRGRVINNTSDKKRVYTFGCFNDNEIWRGSLGSFIIYTYDFFNSLYGTRYCQNDRECKINERCLCKGIGASHPSWCPSSGRRCRAKGYFSFEFPVSANQYKDQIDIKCFNEQMKKLESTGLDNNDVSSALLNDIKRRCAKEKLATIEPFGSIPVTSGTLFIIFLIICILFPIGLFF